MTDTKPEHIHDIEIHKTHRENYLQLMLTLLGVIQGLALNHLADNFPDISSTQAEGTDIDFQRWIGFIVSFCIIIRVFQTYFTASLSKIQLRIETVDLVGIFSVGLLQYWIIDSLNSENFSLKEYFLRVVVLAFAACSLHALTTIRIFDKETIKLSVEEKAAAKKSEVWNLSIASGIAAFCIISIMIDMPKFYYITGMIVSALLLLNINVSLKEIRLSGGIERSTARGTAGADRKPPND